ETVKAGNKRIVTDLDDAFCFLDESHPEYEFYSARNEALSIIMANADENWFSTDNLAAAYKSLASNPTVIPNMLDARVWRNFREHDSVRRNTSRPLRFLYMGTSTHDLDFSMIWKSFEEVAKL